MSKNKQPQVPKKNEVSFIRSSAAEYLTFVVADGDGRSKVNSERAVQFRKWVSTIIESFTIKGELDLSRVTSIAETGVAP